MLSVGEAVEIVVIETRPPPTTRYCNVPDISTAASFASGAPIVALSNVGKTFANGVTALDRLNLDVWPGEFVSLLGPSGCGKSTALRIIAGLSVPTRGKIEWLQRAAASAEGPHRLGFVFQEPTLMPWATVAANVRLPLKLQGLASTARPRVEAALERVGLSGFADSYPRELSGGMKMRTSIARALVTEPSLLLMDEPFAALDEITRFRLNNDLLALWQSLGKTIVFVTHSVFEFVYLSQRIVVHDLAARARLHGARDRCAISARRALPYVGGLCRLLPAGVGSPGECHGGGSMNRARPGGREPAAADETRPRLDRMLRVLLPIAVLALGVVAWETVVRAYAVPPYVLPAPQLVFTTLVADWSVLSASLMVTLVTTLQGFLLAVVGGVGLAVLFNQSRLLEYSLYPYAVILQVTPVVAIAPLLLIYLPQQAAVLACAWIVAFFPVLANTTLGLNSVDHNLVDLFRLYGATRRQVLWQLKLPAALPYVLGGLRIAGGLSLIGAVVAEIAAGSAGAGSGLAYRIAESGYRLNIPRMFAALLLLSVAGIVIFFALSLMSHLLLRRWHESAIVREL